MSRTGIWKRLLWREFRGGWPVVVLGLLAPAVLLPLAGRMSGDEWLRSVLALPATVGVHLAIIFWAVARTSRDSQDKEFTRTHLPVSPLSTWGTSVALPAIICGLIGLWYGHWFGAGSDTDTKLLPLIGAVDLATTFITCSFLAAVLSGWAGALFGVFRIVGGTLLPTWEFSAAIQQDAIWFVSRTAIGALLGSFALAAMSRKRSPGARQGVALLVMLLVVFGPASKDLDISAFGVRKTPPGRVSGGRVTGQRPGYAVYVGERLTRDSVTKGVIRFEYVDKPNGIKRTRDFKPEIQILTLLGDRWAYLAQQKSRRAPVRILEWDVMHGRVRTVAEIPAHGDVLLGENEKSVHKWASNGWGRQAGAPMSPDGRWLWLELRSTAGRGHDYWLVNTQSGKIGMAFACAKPEENSGIRWTKERAVVDVSGRVYLVDYAAVKARRLQLDFGGEDR